MNLLSAGERRPHVSSLIEKANVFALSAGLSLSVSSEKANVEELVQMLLTFIRTLAARVPAGSAYERGTNGT